MRYFLTIIFLLLSGCATGKEIVPIAYLDADYETGIYKDIYFFEGELTYSADGLHKGYVHVTKFLSKTPHTSQDYDWYKGQVKPGTYSVMFDDGPGSYILYGYGSGKMGITVSPSWLPDVADIAKQLSKGD